MIDLKLYTHQIIKLLVKNTFNYFIILYLAVALLSCGSPEEKATTTETSLLEELPPTEVQTETLDSADFYMEIVSNGKLEGIRKSEMRFRINQRISKIYVKNGDWVKKGRLLAQLDDYELRTKLLQSKVALENARITLTDYLIGQGYNLEDSTNIPDKVFSIARIKSGHQKAETDLELAKFNLQQAFLRATSSGAVANLSANENTYPNNQEPFCLIIDNSSMQIKFPVMEPEVDLVSLGQAIKIVPYYQEEEIKGKVTAINPFIDKNGLIQITAVIPSVSKGLFEGMNARIYVRRNIGKSLAVPKGAITLRSERPVVFVFKDGQAKWNYVKTSHENSEKTIITDGLHAGDEVIVKGNLHLANESRVVLK